MGGGGGGGGVGVRVGAGGITGASDGNLRSDAVPAFCYSYAEITHWRPRISLLPIQLNFNI